MSATTWTGPSSGLGRRTSSTSSRCNAAGGPSSPKTRSTPASSTASSTPSASSPAKSTSTPFLTTNASSLPSPLLPPTAPSIELTRRQASSSTNYPPNNLFSLLLFKTQPCSQTFFSPPCNSTSHPNSPGMSTTAVFIQTSRIIYSFSSVKIRLFNSQLLIKPLTSLGKPCLSTCTSHTPIYSTSGRTKKVPLTLSKLIFGK